MTQSPFDEPGAVRLGEELNTAALSGYLYSTLGLVGTLSVAQFKGGYSNLTYLVQMGSTELVLRRPPFGTVGKAAHDMGREYRILTALHPTYHKVPRPIHYCTDTSVIGVPFYLMERVRGLILRNSTIATLNLRVEQMRGVCVAAIRTLAELHQLDYRAAGLGDLGQPDGYIARQISGWANRYQAAQTDDLPQMGALATWLAFNRPADGPPALLHNDFRYDNMVLDPTDLTRPLALLDWEMATVGDGLMDVGTALAYWAEPGDPPALAQFSPTTHPVNLTRQGVMEMYGHLTGRDISHAVFYYVYGLFKLGVVAQQLYARYQQGLTRDKRFAGLITAVQTCAAMGSQAIATGRISEIWP